jgi:hypothetical protein
VPHYFPTCGSMASSAMELKAVLENPAPVDASWGALYPYGSGFEGGGVVVGRPATAADRFEGVINGARTRHSGSRGDVLSPCTPTTLGCRHSARGGATVAGMAAQG